MNKIYQKAINYSQETIMSDSNNEDIVQNNIAFRSFIDGANYMLEKVIRWLQENAENYVWWDKWMEIMQG